MKTVKEIVKTFFFFGKPTILPTLLHPKLAFSFFMEGLYGKKTSTPSEARIYKTMK